jgi:hypothetical protein
MKQKLSIRRMRQHPDIEQLKRQSKELLAAFRAADAAAATKSPHLKTVRSLQRLHCRCATRHRAQLRLR